MINYLNKQGITNIGEKIMANKTAISGTLDTINELNSAVQQIEIDWGAVTGFATKLEELVGCRT